MKLVVNSTSLIPPLSGIGRYTKQLLSCLLDPRLYDNSEFEFIEDIRAFNPLHFYAQEELLQLLHILDNENNTQTAENSLNRLKKIRGIVKHIPGARRLKNNIQQRIFNKNIAQCKDYIYWEPTSILEKFDGVSIPTIHDLSHIHYPQFHPEERRRWLDNNLPATLENSTAIIVVSDFTKKDLMDTYGVSEEKISIVSPAVSDEFRQPYSGLEIQQIRLNYQLPRQFLLSVGTIEPRKNLSGLLTAYQQLPETLKNTCPLVVVGYNGWLSKAIEKLMNPLLAKGQVIRLGYVPQYHLPLIYSAATAFIYISHYEGYGMPIAEAMCSGIPVITSNVSSMPEVAAGSALLVEPDDHQKIALQIQEILENKTLRENLICKAKQQSRTYLWEKSAQKLIKLFSRWDK
ncbi:MAG: glycosyltransferase family 4 protein [gamma proteobacterium symbiont of Taylorina sp.]|nr:glycosyltransferase family 4 protein [gamma proteobacterium symbiont of Taylorina sp.]